jgi:type IV pilus assembly protein PilZ
MKIGRGMLMLDVKNIDILYQSYLPFLRNGGLFYPTDKNYDLGDEVFMLLTLPESKDKRPIAGKIAWVNPKGVQGGRPAGIGVHFGDKDNDRETRDIITKLLAGRLNLEKRTYTM